MNKLPILLFALLLGGCTSLIRPNYTQELAKLRPGQYQLDKTHSYIFFRIDHLGLSKIIGRFNAFDASLDFNPEDITAMQLDGIIESNSIDINNDDLESTLQEDAWFDSARFPQITFESQSIQPRDDGTIDINGNLTMRGITQPIVLNTTFNGGADNLITRKYTIGFSATAQITRSTFGMDSFAAFVGDDIEIELHGEFLRQ
jgi:polyisoprenoid-binding protein YceI